MATAPPRMTTRHTNYSCRELIYQFETNALRIPDYQREFVWPIQKQRKLIMSMLKSRPMGNFIFSEKITTGSYYCNIIDGRQRLGTIKKFFNNNLMVKIDGELKYFRDVDVEIRIRFESISLIATVQSYCSHKEEADIFENTNSGMTLTFGERLKPCDHTPFFQFCNAIIAEFETDLSKLFGKLDRASNRQALLLHMVGMVAGATFGQEMITVKFPVLYELTQTTTEEMIAEKRELTRYNFKRLISIWNNAAKAAAVMPLSIWRNNKLWHMGTFNGYFLYALWEIDAGVLDEELTMRNLSTFLKDCMITPCLLDKMHCIRFSGQALNRSNIGRRRLKCGLNSILRYVVEGVSVFTETIVI